MAAEAQTCAIGIINILNILVALHLSRVLYKFAPFYAHEAKRRARRLFGNQTQFTECPNERK